MVTIQTERLVLRPLEPEDWRRLHAIEAAPGVREHLLPGQATEEAVRAWVEDAVFHARERTGILFGYAVLVPGHAELAGVCSLSVTHPVRRIGYVGWGLAPEHWGRGYATEAAAALVRLGFERRWLLRIRSDCYRDNAASRRVMERVGMRERRTPGARLALSRGYGDARPTVRYEVTRAEWRRMAS